MKEELMLKSYEIAKERYAALSDRAMKLMKDYLEGRGII